MGEGRGGPPVHPQATTWKVSVGRPSGRGIIQQRARTLLNRPPYQHCICNQLRFVKLYTCPNLSARLGLFIVGQLQPQGAMTLRWQRSVDRVRQDTSTWERQARFVIWHWHSFPSVVHRFTSQGPPPNHSCAAWYLLCSSIHALSH